MPKLIGKLPFEPLVTVDSNSPVSPSLISEISDKRQSGVSICVRSEDGHAKRGGYFFHFKRDADKYILVSAMGESLIQLNLDQLVDLINHCSGRMYSDEIFRLFQSKLNFKSD